MEHPYRDGVVLVGDAAASSDPTFGQGLSFAIHAARALRDELTSNSEWDAAGHRYAEQHQRRFHACHVVEGWFRSLFQDPSPEAVSYTHLDVYKRQKPSSAGDIGHQSGPQL